MKFRSERASNHRVLPCSNMSACQQCLASGPSNVHRVNTLTFKGFLHKYRSSTGQCQFMHINANRGTRFPLYLLLAVCPPACTNRSDIGKTVGPTVVSLEWTRKSRWTWKRKDSIFYKGHPFDPRSLSFYESPASCGTCPVYMRRILT